MIRSPSFHSPVRKRIKIATAILGVYGALSIAPGAIASAQSAPSPAAQDAPLPIETQQQLRALMDEGAKASAKKDWDAAYRAVAKAWEIKPLPMIAASLAYIELNLEHYREAAEHLKYFLDNGPENYPEQRADAEEKLTEARKHIASVQVTTNVEGARLFVDGNEVGRAPLSTELYLEPGEHTFKLTHPGYQTAIQTAPLEAGKSVAIPLILRVEPPAPVPVSSAAVSTQDTSARAQSSGIQPRTWVLIGGSTATVVSLGFGIGYAVRAHSLGNDAEATITQIDALSDTTPSQRALQGQCRDRTGTAQTLCERFLSTRDKQDTATNVSTAAFVTAGVLGIATAVTYFLWPTRSSTGKPASNARFRLVPLSVDRAQGAQIHVTF